MTYLIFGIVAAFLYCIASLTGLTYNTINILVYYLLIPLSWTFMGDSILRFRIPWLTIAYALLWIGIFVLTYGHFQTWCDWAFMKSVDFLLWFKHIGWNYYVASVYICVWLPLIIYAVLSGILIWMNPNACNWKPWVIGIATIIIVGWMIEFSVMKFGVKLEPTYKQTDNTYTLSSKESRQIEKDTNGMNEDDIAKYAVKYTVRKLDFSFGESENIDKNMGNCKDYAALCVAVDNHAYNANGLKARASHSVGTIKLFGAEMGKTVSRWLGSQSLAELFRDHYFVTITTSSKTYHLDPSVKEFTGYDLKTIEK